MLRAPFVLVNGMLILNIGGRTRTRNEGGRRSTGRVSIQMFGLRSTPWGGKTLSIENAHALLYDFFIDNIKKNGNLEFLAFRYDSCFLTIHSFDKTFFFWKTDNHETTV